MLIWIFEFLVHLVPKHIISTVLQRYQEFASPLGAFELFEMRGCCAPAAHFHPIPLSDLPPRLYQRVKSAGFEEIMQLPALTCYQHFLESLHSALLNQVRRGKLVTSYRLAGWFPNATAQHWKVVCDHHSQDFRLYAVDDVKSFYIARSDT